MCIRDSVYTDLPPDKQFIEVIAGIDFGYTNPSSMLVIGKDFDNHYWVMHEFYKKEHTNSQLIEVAKNLKSNYHIDLFYPDPAEPDRIEEFNQAGFACREVNKNIALGIDHVQRLFKSDKIHIDIACENLIWELERYRYKEQVRDDLNEKEQPVKKDDHAMDSLRYALFTNEPTDLRESSHEFNLYGESYE
jgi:phage terminase large subunit